MIARLQKENHPGMGRFPAWAQRIVGIVFAFAALLGFASQTRAPTPGLRYEATSPYHHIRVVDSQGIRTLYFDDAEETRMALADPLKGHFEYTDYFHLAWLWNTNISNVLMIGLGGGSAQRAFEHYHPGVHIDSVEIDPLVVDVARTFFHFKESDHQKVHVMDGRMFLRRTKTQYDLVILDAYTQGRYGSSLPQHLATREFFQLARQHLTTNGVVAYNVIGTQAGYRSSLVGAVYRTMQSVFPQVYLCPARTSLNIVLLATPEKKRANPVILRQRAALLAKGQIRYPYLAQRAAVIQTAPPVNLSRSPILSDDYAPVEGLASQR